MGERHKLTFKQELAQLLKREGFYSNDPDDPGGETIYGIARKRWPSWHGWLIVDARKPDQLETLKTNVAFQAAVEQFYSDHFWQPSGAPLLGKAGPLVWDAAVNHGVAQSVIFLQQALNALNEVQKRWPDVKEDGSLGPKTMEVVAKAMDGFEEDLWWSLVVIRGAFYFGLVRQNQSQEKWFRGWMIRVRELYLNMKEEK